MSFEISELMMQLAEASEKAPACREASTKAPPPECIMASTKAPVPPVCTASTKAAPKPDYICTVASTKAQDTSTIVASAFTENLAGRHRCLVAHPVNPPHLVPLVELVAAPWTAPATVTQAKAIYEAVGQVPM